MSSLFSSKTSSSAGNVNVLDEEINGEQIDEKVNFFIFVFLEYFYRIIRQKRKIGIINLTREKRQTNIKEKRKDKSYPRNQRIKHPLKILAVSYFLLSTRIIFFTNHKSSIELLEYVMYFYLFYLDDDSSKHSYGKQKFRMSTHKNINYIQILIDLFHRQEKI